MEKPIHKLLGKVLVVFVAVLIGLTVDFQGGESSASKEKQAIGSYQTSTKLVYLVSVRRYTTKPLRLNSVDVIDTGGNARSIYLPNEPLVFVGKGVSAATTPTEAEVTWSIQGPCGVTTAFKGVVSLVNGSWSHLQPSVSPNCIGEHTYTMQIRYQTQMVQLSKKFTVNPSTVIRATTKPAFDRCYMPSVANMQVWWNKSPYFGVNIYLGGINQACSAYNVDASWIRQVSQQGWEFILTWVGPQPPCSKYYYKMSTNLATAYQQGRTEASAAAAASNRIGMLGRRVIYYDVESYSTNVTYACRAVAKSFINGWAERLHELGLSAGAYGGCGSYPYDWAATTTPPDNVWLAYWQKPYYYNADVDVNAVPCVPKTAWKDHQRLRQYAGDHVESWGGYAMTIDSNATDGNVTVMLTSTASVPSMVEQENLATLNSPALRDLQLVKEGSGWILAGDDLLWSTDDGNSWQAITPEINIGGSILAAWFLSPEKGWVVVEEAAALRFLKTQDGGINWEPVVQAIDTGSLDAPISSGSLQFIDENTGWLAVKLQSGSSISLGELYRTMDGGATWEQLELPAGGTINFLDRNVGTLTGGIDGMQKFETEDGGNSWRTVESVDAGLVQVVPELNGQATQLMASSMLMNQLPEGAQVFTSIGGTSAWVLRWQGGCSGVKGEANFACTSTSTTLKTNDSGMTWSEISPFSASK